MSESSQNARFVGRGGLKLAAALDAIAIDPAGKTAADFGCNVGGFTDCLLQRGARRVHAIDTGYGALDYRLRTDERVVVMERTNALHADPPDGGVDLIAIDLGWTTQRIAIPAALGWLAPGGDIITLIKPHYEAQKGPERESLQGGVLGEDVAQRVVVRVVDELPDLGVDVRDVIRSPILGGKGKGNKKGNVEFLAHVRRRGDD